MIVKSDNFGKKYIKFFYKFFTYERKCAIIVNTINLQQEVIA